MVVLLGSKQSGSSTTTVGSSDTLRHGIVYEAVYPVSGIGTFFPGWENDAINKLTQALAEHDCAPTYFEVHNYPNPNAVTVQFQYIGSESTSAMFAPIVWYVVLALVVFGIIAWITLTAPSTVTAIGAALSENPVFTYAMYGIIAIAGIYVITNFIREWRETRSGSD